MRSSKLVHISEYNAVEQSGGSWLHDDGEIFWYNKEGEVHREDGPAVIYPDGRVEWWWHDDEYPFYEWLEETPLSLSDEEKLLLRLCYG
jgi:hypothetical protein